MQPNANDVYGTRWPILQPGIMRKEMENAEQNERLCLDATERSPRRGVQFIPKYTLRCNRVVILYVIFQ